MNNFKMQLIKKYKKEYIKASKKEKSVILDECIKLTKLKRNTIVQKFKRAKNQSAKLKRKEGIKYIFNNIKILLKKFGYFLEIFVQKTFFLALKN